MSGGDAAPTRELDWAELGWQLFDRKLGELDDNAFGAATALPDWTVAHLVAHLADNAEALQRLATWARTGVETPMYASSDARNAGIDRGATRPAAELRDRVGRTDAALRADLAGLPDAAWSASVVTAQGRTVPAAQIAWMRVREVWIHAVDLGNGMDFDRFPADLTDALLTDVTGQRERLGRAPALTVTPDDRDRRWHVRVGDAEPVAVRGTAADLTRWLTGRGTTGVTAPGGPPELGRWL